MSDKVYYCKKCKKYVDTGSSSVMKDDEWIRTTFCWICFKTIFKSKDCETE